MATTTESDKSCAASDTFIFSKEVGYKCALVSLLKIESGVPGILLVLYNNSKSENRTILPLNLITKGSLVHGNDNMLICEINIFT